MSFHLWQGCQLMPYYQALLPCVGMQAVWCHGNTRLPNTSSLLACVCSRKCIDAGPSMSVACLGISLALQTICASFCLLWEVDDMLSSPALHHWFSTCCAVTAIVPPDAYLPSFASGHLQLQPTSHSLCCSTAMKTVLYCTFALMCLCCM